MFGVKKWEAKFADDMKRKFFGRYVSKKLLSRLTAAFHIARFTVLKILTDVASLILKPLRRQILKFHSGYITPNLQLIRQALSRFIPET